MEFGLHQPYFLLELSDRQDGYDISRSVLTSSLAMVVNASKYGAEGAYVERVGLLSPGFINGTRNYQLHQLLEIWAEDPEDPC